jgi:hypothetical protein
MMDRRKLLKAASLFTVAGLIPMVSAAAGAERAGRLLLVHGRDQQGLNPDTLKAEWLDTLQLGTKVVGRTLPIAIDVAFPYYGDMLDNFTRQYDIPLTSDMHSRGPLDDEFLMFQAEFAEEVRKRVGVTDSEVDAEYGNNPQPRGPLNWQWVQAILRAIDKHGGMSQKTLELFTRDVFLYTTRAGVRDEIDRIVGGTLTEQPTVIVGHSLGSVVAYSVLSTDRRSLRVPLFVTLGSPLSIRGVRDQFRPLRSPPVSAWYNAFDTRDVVALHPLDTEHFPVQPPIQNDNRVKNQTANHHGIAGYLNNPDVAKRILDSLGT